MMPSMGLGMWGGMGAPLQGRGKGRGGAGACPVPGAGAMLIRLDGPGDGVVEYFGCGGVDMLRNYSKLRMMV